MSRSPGLAQASPVTRTGNNEAPTRIIQSPRLRGCSRCQPPCNWLVLSRMSIYQLQGGPKNMPRGPHDPAYFQCLCEQQRSVIRVCSK